MSTYDRIWFLEAEARREIDDQAKRIEEHANSVLTVNVDEEVMFRGFDDCYPTDFQLASLINALERMRRLLNPRRQVCHPD
jgi:LmbE family N-acetylglucosaminyl deacetylase